jgi:hypothetical protein
VSSTNRLIDMSRRVPTNSVRHCSVPLMKRSIREASGTKPGACQWQRPRPGRAPSQSASLRASAIHSDGPTRITAAESDPRCSAVPVASIRVLPSCVPLPLDPFSC